MQFSSSSNVAISGFSVDMQRLPFTLCQALSASGGSTKCQFDPQQYPFAGAAAAFPWLKQAQAIIEYDKANDRMGTSEDIYALDDPIPITVEGNVMTIAKEIVAGGKWYVVRHAVYGHDGIDANEVTGLQVTDVTFYALPGMGVVTYHSSDIHLLRVRTLKRQQRPMSITADGVHLTSCRGGRVVLEDCVFEGQGDDGLNIPSLYQDILTIDPSRRVVTVGSRGEQKQAPQVDVGDQLVVYSRHTFTPLATVVVATLNSTSLVLRDPLPDAIRIYDLLWDSNSAPDSVLLKGSTFRANRARGALLKASNLLAINNTFDHTTGPGIQAYPDGCYWFEGNVVTNWTLQNNRFLGTNYGTAKLPGNVFVAACVPVWNGSVPLDHGGPATAQTVFHQLNIAGNYFEQTQAEAALTMYAVSMLNVSDNVVVFPNGAPANNHFTCTACTGVTLTGNRCGHSTQSLQSC
eukprot:TRINITY_DN8065_c0_g1_i2.p2 TRINITY_DN8065_c0_g1~~TRINITY_DN8065_c0_g1_i2.p2  ORF type:complete len:462 (-),score=97.34 TRINITY_DN8065_c0_g1_i2:72-1457(-)